MVAASSPSNAFSVRTNRPRADRRDLCWLRKRAHGAVDRLDQLPDRPVAVEQADQLERVASGSSAVIAVWWQTDVWPEGIPASCWGNVGDPPGTRTPNLEIESSNPDLPTNTHQRVRFPAETPSGRSFHSLDRTASGSECLPCAGSHVRVRSQIRKLARRQAFSGPEKTDSNHHSET